MEIIEVSKAHIAALAPLVAAFRVELRSFKGITSKPNVQAGAEELEEYVAAGFSVFAAVVDGEYAGYAVCRVDSEVVWVESIFVSENTAGTASLLRCIVRLKHLLCPTVRIQFITMCIPITTV